MVGFENVISVRYFAVFFACRDKFLLNAGAGSVKTVEERARYKAYYFRRH